MVKVLLADDEADSRALLSYLLSDDGFEVRPAADGKELRQALLQERFDVLLLDWVMPESKGPETIAWVNALPRAPKIIVLTALTIDEVPAGAAFVVTKPIGVKELEALILRVA